MIPALGGTEHRLYTGPANRRTGGSRLDWSPDGGVLAFAESTAANRVRSRIALLSLTDLTIRPLTSPPQQEYDCEAAFSPDGLRVAFERGSIGGGGRDLFVLPVTGGEPRRLTFDNFGGSPVWTQDGSDIVFSSERGGFKSLWRISASGGTPRPVQGVGAPAFSPSIPRKGDPLIYQHFVSIDNIWRLNLKDDKKAHGPPVRVISTRGFNLKPNFSPDGKKIAFESDRLGYSDIWYCDGDGSNCAQVTSLHGTLEPRGGRRTGITLHLNFNPNTFTRFTSSKYLVAAPSLVPTFPGTDNGAPNWSRDGQWIYFYSTHEKGLFQLWKVP